MNKNTLFRGFSLMSLTLLTACGGGGSGGVNTPTPDPVAKVCSNGAIDYPTCTPTFVAADLQLTVPTPPFLADSQELKAFNYLNDLRSELGLGKLAYNANLQKASINHGNYLKTNSVFTHEENSGLPGYTGKTPAERAVFSGYSSPGLVGEGIGSSNTAPGAMKRLIDSVYHRGDLFKQYWRDFGFAAIDQGNNSVVLVINPAYKDTKQRNASDFVLMYPKNGETNVDIAMCGEAPWPFPDVNSETSCGQIINGQFVRNYTVGYPISFSIENSLSLEVQNFTITENGSNSPLSAWVLTSSSDPNKRISANEAYLATKGGLKVSTRYNVKFEGRANGKSISRDWSFTTASAKHSSN